MPICHYRLTADNQRIQIPNTIHGQDLLLDERLFVWFR